MAPKKPEIVTFKADDALLDAMKGIPNRSAFIRSAILAALDGSCPVCRGAGILSPKQGEHWKAFAKGHSIEECDECHELHLVCANERKGRSGGKRGSR
ncbi:MAG: CopG family transcriptional regulator [Planctomycetota bacterium]